MNTICSDSLAYPTCVSSCTDFNNCHISSVRDHVRVPKGQVPKSMYQASQPVPNDFHNNFSYARS